MIDGVRVLDADAHVVEPGDLFSPWCPPGRVVLDLPATTPAVPCGDAELVADQLEHGFDAESYLRAMDAQGIDAVVLYPSIGLFVPFLPELSPGDSADACRAYNEWVAGYCATDPLRLAAVGVVPQADPALAAGEAKHAVDLGLVGALARPNPIGGRGLGDDALEPLYEVLAGRGAVLAVHEGLGLRQPTIGADRFTSFAGRHVCSHPMEQMAAMAGLFLGGVLERHPALRVAFLESGTGWLPYWLHRLDEHHEWLADTECAALTRSASECFERQCIVSTDPDDDLTGWVVSRIGADHVVWASDFPHPDARFPDAARSFIADAELSDADLRAVLWDTPLRFYRLDERFASAG